MECVIAKTMGLSVKRAQRDERLSKQRIKSGRHAIAKPGANGDAISKPLAIIWGGCWEIQSNKNMSIHYSRKRVGDSP